MLALLARERRKIIMALQEKQEKIVLAMKKELLNEIKRGIMSYKVNDIILIVLDWGEGQWPIIIIDIIIDGDISIYWGHIDLFIRKILI